MREESISRAVSGDRPLRFPDEYLNRDVKAGLAERAQPSDSEAVKSAVVEHLSERKRNPEKVRNLFKKPEVRYAAADALDEV